ncbi:unnamed protein product [Euphydryas editha]|uniref:ER-bound oxygenase mpaB/mpaB'/Rubber oxygenase catalytic domain-containing protein n=1 Tax=Euphydryas editha TaxID=104508 RepID=A0AAU9U6Z7_EUPED|nr:unnamed protein product [Euphydryas editha]
MDLSVDEYIDGLFSKQAFEQPSDTKKPEDMEMRIPEWFDEKQFNKARRFYWDNAFQFTASMLLGLVAVFSVPSILRVLVGSRRSSSVYTAYKRYLSTLLHTVSWFENELKPGSISWRSLMTVRSRHLRASVAADLKGQGIVSQRDLALTQFGFIGLSLLKTDEFGIQQMEDGDWEAYNHFWRVIGHAIGIEDRYNICRKNVEETQQVCQILLDRVYTPYLENVPEYFEHMTRVMLDGMWSVNPTVHIDGLIYWTKYLCNVPGFIYKESERRDLQKRIKEKLNGKSEDIGVDAMSLMAPPLVELPARQPHLLYLHDYDSIYTVPTYKKLSLSAKYKLALNVIIKTLYTSYLWRLYFNMMYRFSLFLMKYFPYVAFFRFGVMAAYTNIFNEDPIGNEEPKPNEYYYNQPPSPLYKEVLSLLW